MKGYGFSIWVVPHNHQVIRNQYKMKHIPHITVKTNMIIPEKIFGKKFCKINFKNSFCCEFPSMYQNDPLTACGFYCDINIPTDHDPHITLWYNHSGPLDSLSPPQDTHGQVFLADTRSINPSEWKIIF